MGRAQPRSGLRRYVLYVPPRMATSLCAKLPRTGKQKPEHGEEVDGLPESGNSKIRGIANGFPSPRVVVSEPSRHRRVGLAAFAELQGRSMEFCSHCVASRSRWRTSTWVAPARSRWAQLHAHGAYGVCRVRLVHTSELYGPTAKLRVFSRSPVFARLSAECCSSFDRYPIRG